MEAIKSDVNESEIQEARDYLSSLINKYLRVTSTDGRIFWGQFRCIDPVRVARIFPAFLLLDPPTTLIVKRDASDCPADRICGKDHNIVLSQTFEYRQPSAQKRLEAAQVSGASEKTNLQMTSRFLGLVVIPGQHIAKVELEEFACQLKKPSAAAAEALQKRREIERAQR
ncbi:hypothetical protein jhhlp_005170 [Lomentospora prolificans]|uniref:LSM domain-containing protein n=1 Tax=Lomentospora prolificans TaxID=41688 RepID=A0A2N3N719_9PEZI|nr:hypothetical protein jhhlp_005170 [Lomentospora prolificans]